MIADGEQEHSQKARVGCPPVVLAMLYPYAPRKNIKISPDRYHPRMANAHSATKAWKRVAVMLGHQIRRQLGMNAESLNPLMLIL